MDQPRDPIPSTDTWSAEQDLQLARGAARRLASAADADDLAQEAWLVARRHRSGIENRPAWMRRVVERLWLKRNQSERARRRREDGHRSAAADYELDELERDELRQAVRAELEDLPEIYAEALELRFVEELTPSEIAERTGLSVETVRTRIRRGQANLKERLERRAGPRAESWLSALVFFPTERPAAATTGPLASLGLGAWLLGALGVVLTGLFFWAGGLAPEQPRFEAAVFGPEERRQPTPLEPVAEAGEAVRMPLETAAPAEAGAVLGRAGGGPSPDPFAVRGLLEDGGRLLEGRVVDARGQPVPGAEVVFERGRLRTPLASADGRGRFEARLPAEEGWLFARARGHATTGGRWTLDPTLRGPEELRFQLADEGTHCAAGTVLDPRGQPVAGAQVALLFDLGATHWDFVDQSVQRPIEPDPVRAGVDGRFQLDFAVASNPVLFAWSQDGWAKRGLPTDGVASGVELTLEPWVEFAGRLRWSEDFKAPASVAWISPLGRGELLVDGDGRFNIPRLASGPLELQARSGTRAWRSTVELPPNHGAGLGPAPRVTLEGGAVLTGQASSPEGEPLRGWTVRAVKPPGKQRTTQRLLATREAEAEATTDPEGAFELYLPVERPWVIALLSPSGREAAVAADVTPSSEPLELRDAAPGGLRGKLVVGPGAPTPEPGAQRAGFELFVDRFSWTRPRRIAVEADMGAFAVEGLAPGRYALVCIESGLGPRVLGRPVVAAGATSEAGTLYVCQTRSLLVQVLDQEGAPVPDRKAAILAGSPEHACRRDAPVAVGETDAEGLVRFERLPEGELTVRLGYSPGPSASFHAVPDGPLVGAHVCTEPKTVSCRLAFQLPGPTGPATERWSFQVLDEDDVRVLLQSMAGHQNRGTLARRLLELEPGQYRVEATYGDWTAQAEVEVGGPGPVDLGTLHFRAP